MKKRIGTLISLLAALLLLAGCKGEALPAGMDEEALIDAGREVVVLLGKEEYESVYEMFREDVRESTTAQAVQELVLAETEDAGIYKQIDKYMTTGQTVGDTAVGIAVFYCDYSEDDVLMRVSFDPEMELVGLSVRRQ